MIRRLFRTTYFRHGVRHGVGRVVFLSFMSYGLPAKLPKRKKRTGVKKNIFQHPIVSRLGFMSDIPGCKQYTRLFIKSPYK